MSINAIAENIANIYAKIHEAEKKYGRGEGSVRLLAVSKFHPADSVMDAYNAGQKFFGENRIQEAKEKFSPLIEKFPDINLHIIGSLQTNKVKNAVQIASCIESVDRLSLIEEIEKQCARIDKTIEIYLEMHTGEESKSGFADEAEIKNALEFCAAGKSPHVIPRGFMTMAPFTDDKDAIRLSFSTLRVVAEKMRKVFPEFNLSELSMGMTNDFEIAIEEGSTEVRIGTAIFGGRT